MTHPLVILNRKQSASDWGSRDYSLDSRFRGNDTFFVILNRLPPLVILNRRRSASDWGSRDYRLDSRFHGNDGRGAGMTKGRHGNDGK